MFPTFLRKGKEEGKMKRKESSVVMLALLLTSIFVLESILPLKAIGKITIKSDGSIDPPTAPIITFDNVTYTLLDNIYDTEIWIEKNNIIFDGNDYMLQGSAAPESKGFYLEDRMYVAIKDTTIKGFSYGVYLGSSHHIYIFENNITENNHGVFIDNSWFNEAFGNNITNNNISGVYIKSYSDNNKVFDNFIEGHRTGGGYGVYLGPESDNNEVFLNSIRDNEHGVYLISSQRDNVSRNDITYSGKGIYSRSSIKSTISGNNITKSSYGVYLDLSSDENIVSENNIAENGRGISVENSKLNTVSGNNITKSSSYGLFVVGSNSRDNALLGNKKIENNKEGIRIDSAYNTKLRENNITGNELNFGVYGSQESNFIHDIDSSNTVDGKPVYYFRYNNSLLINPSTYPSIGYLALVKSENITVEGLELKNNGQGILLAFTKNSRIINNTLMNNIDGIYLRESSYNLLSENNITKSSRSGVFLSKSSDNNVASNTITESRVSGVYLYYSSLRNNVSGNIIEGMSISYGVYLQTSANYNHVNGNNIRKSYSGVYLQSSIYNNISGNTITDSGHYGVHLLQSSKNYPIYNNTIINSKDYGVYVSSSDNITITRNTIKGSKISGGVYLGSSSSGAVTENNLTDSGNGVYFSNTLHSNITGNSITDSSSHGVYLSLSNYNNVSGNTITNSITNPISIRLGSSDNNTVSANNITGSNYGIYLSSSKLNTVSRNIIEDNIFRGVSLLYSDNNIVLRNTVKENQGGVQISWSNDNTIAGNTLEDNFYGIYLYSSFDNRIYHNNLVNNTRQAYSEDSVNVWDNSYPSGGNYWSDYIDMDLYHGTGQNVTGSDGIWDHPYDDIANIIDHYPLAAPSIIHAVGVINVIRPSNRTIVGIGFTEKFSFELINQGQFTETLNVSIYADPNVTMTGDEIIIYTLNFTLNAGSSVALDFIWNTNATKDLVPKGIFTIGIYVTPVPGEIYTEDNTYLSGLIRLALACDIANRTFPDPGSPDGRVDYKDLSWLLKALGSTPSSPNWNPNLDFAGSTTTPPAPPDGKVNYIDVFWMLKNYGKTDL